MTGPRTRELDERVVILAPSPKDGALTRSILAEVDIGSRICLDMAEAVAEIARGAGALLIPEEARSPAVLRRAWRHAGLVG